MRPNGFRLETEVVKVLTSRGPSTLRRPASANRQLMVFPELEVGMVIPDLVVVFRGQSLPKRSARGISLTDLDSHVLAAFLRGKPRLSCYLIARHLYSSPSRTAIALSRLHRYGILRKDGEAYFTLNVKAIPTRLHVVAIEAKLLRWRDALSQANTYKRFSNRCYVALPKYVIARNPKIKPACKADGIGLIGVEKSALSVVVESSAFLPQTPEWVALLAKTVGFQSPQSR